MIIAIFGLPGSGKTFFARKLAERIDADYVGTDWLRKELLSKPTYTEKEKIKIYKAMSEILYDHAKSAKHLVMDGTFYKKKIREEFEIMTRHLGLNMIWIEVVADKDVVKKRLEHTREDSDADLDIHDLIKQSYEPKAFGQLVIKSTDDNIESMLTEAITYIKEKQYEMDMK